MILMTAKPVIQERMNALRIKTAAFQQKTGRLPRLVVVLVGSNPASVIYTRKKEEASLSIGMEHETISMPDTVTPAEVKRVIDGLNQDPSVDGILVQRPLPPTFREEEVLFWISPEKDVDAFHPLNTGKLALGLPCFLPCTPAGIMDLLKYYSINPSGKLACVVGRSSIVGKPMAALLLQANATILHCHSKTFNLKELTSQADILVIAIGKPEIIDRSYVKEGAVVIDVGIHRTSEGKIVGDVHFASVSERTQAITPVPGGVGPMTISMLLQNTLMAAELKSN